MIKIKKIQRKGREQENQEDDLSKFFLFSEELTQENL